jgi:putative methyltransferase (TIGR04325 family)
MNNKLTTLARNWVPPEALRLLRAWLGYGIRFSGEFAMWERATAQATGYDAPEILARVAEATRKVRSGDAAFERDSVLFAEPQYPYPLIAGLLRIAAKHGGRLSVVDFGGALGSSYYQCRDFLTGLPEVRWCVVEQPQFVSKGREEFANEALIFADSVEDACIAITPNVIIFSSVLQYVPDPWATLMRVRELDIQNVIIDRTPVIPASHDIIALQTVPKRISSSSYPIRLFTRSSLLNPLEKDYHTLAEFNAVDGILGDYSRPVQFKGFILERCVECT